MKKEVQEKLVDTIKNIPQAVIPAIGEFIKVFIKPFLFSTNKSTLIVPYFYVMVGNILLFISIGLFLHLAYVAAIDGIKDSTTVLGTLSGLIATLTIFSNLMITVYNNGKDRSHNDMEQK